MDPVNDYAASRLSSLSSHIDIEPPLRIRQVTGRNPAGRNALPRLNQSVNI